MLTLSMDQVASFFIRMIPMVTSTAANILKGSFVASDAFCELDAFGACIRNMMYINQGNQVHDVNRVHQIHHSHKGGTRHIRDPEVEFCSDKIKLTESLFW